MKVALERMGDIKGVLNRFFGNEDLFDEKMDLKPQKVTRPPQPVKETTPLPPSRDKSRQGNTQKLKPISRVKNDDDDFWRADFKSRNPAYWYCYFDQITSLQSSCSIWNYEGLRFSYLSSLQRCCPRRSHPTPAFHKIFRGLYFREELDEWQSSHYQTLRDF